MDENIPRDPTVQTGYRDLTQQQVAEENWDSKVLSQAQHHALSWEDMKSRLSALKPGSSIFVLTTDTVSAISGEADRERLLTVGINDATVPVAINPAIRSNAIRDAAGLTFAEFTNQVEFACLTKALNQQAVKQFPIIDGGWVSKPPQMLLAVIVLPDWVQDVVAVSLKQEQP